MNHLVILDARAGELEKILSGVKTMLVKANGPAHSGSHPVNPGDSLYFLRDHADGIARVKATVVRVLPVAKHGEDGQWAEDLAQALKAMQPRLHLTEDQYNYWIEKQQVLLVEFGSAHKIDLFQVDCSKIQDQSDWISFEECRLLMK